MSRDDHVDHGFASIGRKIGSVPDQVSAPKHLALSINNEPQDRPEKMA